MSRFVETPNEPAAAGFFLSAGLAMKVTFELYSRTGCHLCEEMEQEVAALESSLEFSADIITIEGNERLETLYGDKVPVLAFGDKIICQYVLDENLLREAIKQHS